MRRSYGAPIENNQPEINEIPIVKPDAPVNKSGRSTNGIGIKVVGIFAAIIAIVIVCACIGKYLQGDHIVESGSDPTVTQTQSIVESTTGSVLVTTTTSESTITSSPLIIRTSENDVDPERRAADDIAMLEWITPAFTYNNIEEYKTNRNIYVERLGEDHEFVTTYMIYPGDYDNALAMKIFNMYIHSFESYLIDVDETNEIRTYATYVGVGSDYSAGYSGGGSYVTIVYKLDSTQKVLYFACQNGQVAIDDAMSTIKEV